MLELHSYDKRRTQASNWVNNSEGQGYFKRWSTITRFRVFVCFFLLHHGQWGSDRWQMAIKTMVAWPVFRTYLEQILSYPLDYSYI